MEDNIINQEVNSTSVVNEDNLFEYEVGNCKFYRVEIFDETENLRIAIGNPIWNN